MQVIIGVDPHKASHTAVAIDTSEDQLDPKEVRAAATQVGQLLAWAEPFPTRTWAIEGADGTGFLLAQQLIATGEHVVDVPPTLAARTRLLGSGRTNKNDPNDALSVAITALRTSGLRQVPSAGQSEVLRLLAKRNKDIGNQRTRVVCRLHGLLVQLTPGGISKEINASDVARFLAEVAPATPAEQLGYGVGGAGTAPRGAGRGWGCGCLAATPGVTRAVTVHSPVSRPTFRTPACTRLSMVETGWRWAGVSRRVLSGRGGRDG